MILGDKYKAGWERRNTLSSLFTLLIWFIRGLFFRLFWRSSKGLVLIGPSVIIISGHKLSVGKNFIVERGAEINCISSEGIQLVKKLPSEVMLPFGLVTYMVAPLEWASK